MSVQAYNWAGWTSEEYGPKVCDNDKFVNGFKCSGRYCDWVNLKCENPSTVGNLGARNWLSRFSEEGTNYRYCPYNRYISGISTTGRYSDNILLECAYGPNQKKIIVIGPVGFLKNVAEQLTSLTLITQRVCNAVVGTATISGSTFADPSNGPKIYC